MPWWTSQSTMSTRSPGGHQGGGGHGHVVEEAEAHRPVGQGVVAGRSGRPRRPGAAARRPERLDRHQAGARRRGRRSPTTPPWHRCRGRASRRPRCAEALEVVEVARPECDARRQLGSDRCAGRAGSTAPGRRRGGGSAHAVHAPGPPPSRRRSARGWPCPVVVRLSSDSARPRSTRAHESLPHGRPAPHPTGPGTGRPGGRLE